MRSFVSLIIFFSVRNVHAEWSWYGDLRLRAQAEKNGDSQTRWLERIRLRVGVNAQIDEELRTEVRLASATSNKSANQTLGDGSAPGAPRRIFGLDLAYIEWKPLFFSRFYAGKIPQLNYKPGGSTVILDENISLEGFGAVLDYDLNENWRGVLAAGSVIIRENYDTYYAVANTDNNINWAQARVEFKNSGWRLTGGGGFYNFTAMQGKNFADLVKDGKANGNTEGPVGKVKYPFLPHQYFLEAVAPAGSVDVAVFGEKIVNGEAPTHNSSLWVGMSATHKVWDILGAYGEIQADAVPALFTNADFAGGVTDSRGWVVAARWKFAKNMAFRVTEFINRIQASSLNKEYHKTYLDFSASF